MALKTLEERLSQVLEMTADVEIVQCYLVLTFEIEVLEDEILGLSLEIYFLKSIVEQKRLV